MRPYESDGLTAYRQLPMVVVLPEHHRAGRGNPALLPPRGHQGGAARRRHLAVGRRAAACRRRAARHGQIQPHPRDRFRQPRRGGGAGRHQSGGVERGRKRRLLLRARPVLADRLYHRRQYRGKLRRHALPEIRHDHQQRARLRDRADDRRDAAHRRQALGRAGLRPSRPDHRLGGPARRGHRSDRAHLEEAGDRARGTDRLSRARRTPAQCVSAHHRRRHHPRRHGDDGRAGDSCRRRVHACRLSARRRGAAHRRARRTRGRGRSPDHAHRADRQGLQRDLGKVSNSEEERNCSGPGARRPFQRSGASRPITTAWTAPSRARNCRWCCTA